MKILFVTGDENCVCGGTGKIPIGKTWNDNRYCEAFGLCSCVKAMEATVEYRGTFTACGDPSKSVKQGAVCPKEKKDGDKDPLGG